MESYQTNTALCFDKFKTAAIYFDQVIPLSMTTFAKALVSSAVKGLNIGDSKSDIKVATDVVKGLSESSDFEDMVKIIYGNKDLKNEYECYVQWADTVESYAAQVRRSLPGDRESQIEKVISEYSGNSEKNHQKFLEAFGAQRASLFLSDKKCFLDDSTSNNVLICLDGIDTIDAENAEIAQIVELRNDKDAHLKLRKFRSFINKQYQNESIDYIEDDLNVRINEYRSIAKKHGFELLTSSMGSIIDAKNIQAALGAGLTAALFGGPVTGLSAAVAIELSAVCLTVAKGVFTYREMLGKHEMAYLFHASKVLNNK